MNVISDKIFFTNNQGFKIAARLDRPAGQIKHYAVYAPCFTCTKEIHIAVRLTTLLAEHGIATLRLDFTGLGESEGQFENINFSTFVTDLQAAIAYLEQYHGKPQLLIGHSLGGTAALVATHLNSGIKAVVTINSPCHPQHVGRRLYGREQELDLKGEVDVEIAGRTFKIQKQFFDDLQKYNMDQMLPHLNAALLVLHAPNDDTVNIRNANYIFSTSIHPKSFISLDNMDHLVTNRNDAPYLADIIYAWSTRYLNQ